MRAIWAVPILASILILGLIGFENAYASFTHNTGQFASDRLLAIDGNLVAVRGLSDVLHVYDHTTGISTNIGLKTIDANVGIDGNLVVFQVIEVKQGSDLNGDGDKNDLVLHVYDHTTGISTNIGLATSTFAIDGNLVAFKVRESDQGSDLNGDGDMNDSVLHVYDHTTGISTNIGLATNTFAIDGNLVVFLVEEFRQGSDLNGDGDKNDLVLHVYDHTTGTITNLGLATRPSAIDGNLVAFVVEESSQGSDLNGDGDKNDLVLHVYDHTTGTITNLGLAIGNPLLSGNLVAFIVIESSQGSDLNGDGDMNDAVLHVYDHTTGTITNLGLAIDSVSTPAFAIDGNLVAFKVSETNQGSDVNGDGDMNDLLVRLYDHTTGISTNLGQRQGFFSDDVLQIEGNLVLFVAIAEFPFFGDQLHIYDHTTGTSAVVAIATSSAQLQGSLVFYVFFESGGVDLNLDGDDNDAVLHVYDHTTGISTNLRLATARTASDGGLVAFVVGEIAQSSDLNGDGSVSRRILHVYDAPGLDSDNDGFGDQFDNCSSIPNASQEDTNSDGIGDACESLIITCGTGTILQVDECVQSPAVTQQIADLQADLTTAQADLATAQADLATAQADLATAQADLATTLTELGTALDDLNTAQADLATAQADLATAQADLAEFSINFAQPILDAVSDLVNTNTLDTKDADSLIRTLDRSLRTSERAEGVACGGAESLVDDVNGLIADGTLTQTQAQPLLDRANELLATCTP